MSVRRRTNESGQVAILFAIAAVGLVAVLGLAFDAGQSFVTQRALQASADTVAQSGAAMLLQDYNACTATSATGDSPYSPTAISNALLPLIANDTAAQGRANETTQFEFVGPTGVPLGAVSALYTSPFCTSAVGWTGPSGIEVTTHNTHFTTFLAVVGIRKASDAASATALIGKVTGASGVPFGVWSIYCPSGDLAGVSPGDLVVLQSATWDKTTCGSEAYSPGGQSGTRGSFKGFFNLAAPFPVNSTQGCLQTGVGTGNHGESANPPSANTLVYVPLITSVTSFGGTPPPGCPAISVNGTFDLTFDGFVAVLISPPTSASEVEGVVQPIVPSLTPGLQICPVRDLSCTGQESSAPATFYLWK